MQPDEHECTHKIGVAIYAIAHIVFKKLYLLYGKFMPGRTNISLKTMKKNRKPHGTRELCGGTLRELTTYAKQFHNENF